MAEFARLMPAVMTPLIDERDQYLMASLEEAEGDTLVAVVGAGHVEGMKKTFKKQVDRDALARIPPKRRWTSLLKWIIPAVILAAFYIGYTQNQGASIPGIRPGKRTAEYLTQKTRRITLVGALFLGVVAVLPWLIGLVVGLFPGVGSGINTGNNIMLISSTGLLITVGVILDTMRQLEAQLQMRHYDKFLRRGILG